MLAIEAIQWWYSAGYKRFIQTVLGALGGISRTFSVPILIMTLFAPWRRIITYGGRTVIDGLKAMLDNLISRCVGFVVRSIVLLAAAILATATAIFGTLAIIAWPLAPVIAVCLIIWGLLPW